MCINMYITFLLRVSLLTTCAAQQSSEDQGTCGKQFPGQPEGSCQGNENITRNLLISLTMHTPLIKNVLNNIGALILNDYIASKMYPVLLSYLDHMPDDLALLVML